MYKIKTVILFKKNNLNFFQPFLNVIRLTECIQKNNIKIYKMKSLKLVIFSFLACSLFLTSCLTDECNETRQFTQYNPVFMTADEFRINVEVEGQRNINNPGKMYYYKDMLFINEQGKGIHIYDNSDATNPAYIAYYNIPGNFDIAIKDDLLMADNVIDLITIDISNIMNPVITSRIEDYNERYTYWQDDEDREYVAYSVATEVITTLDCSDPNFNNNNFWRGNVFFAEVSFDTNAPVLTGNQTSSTGSSSTGISGSTARFTIVNDYLYTVDNNSLSSYKIYETNVEKEADKSLGWGIETIFPYKNNLFIGSNSGMFIYSLENPASPYQLSTFQHARACDPVVANDTHAFVTLRDGSLCEGFINQLDVIDIASLTNPKLVKSYPMVNPHGLTLNGDYLYISEGDFGIKVIDIENPANVKELSFDREIASTDLIYLGNNHLLSIGKDGLSQYDVSDPSNMELISLISVE